jgi:hypothetical protein
MHGITATDENCSLDNVRTREPEFAVQFFILPILRILSSFFVQLSSRGLLAVVVLSVSITRRPVSSPAYSPLA